MIKFIIYILSFLPNIILNFSIKGFSYISYIFNLSQKKKDYLKKIQFENIEIKLLLAKNSDQAHDVYKKISRQKIYELPLTSILIKFLDTKKLFSFLDVGSFMGYYTCLISKYFENFSDLKTYSIESNKYFYNYIKKNISINNLKNVSVYNEILSDKEENLSVRNEKVIESKDGDQILSRTLDNLCEKNNIIPDIVKIDVHAFESKVFDGFKSNLAQNVKIILLELHSNDLLLKVSSKDKFNIINDLERYNFKCYLVPFENDLKIYDVGKNFDIKNYKINCRLITKDNFQHLFFDKLYKDNLIVCIKDEFLDFNKILENS
tara:strand:- start:48 stop:1007 length:960 start_codon:yes stop_codon:yes gene_type:complete